VEADRARQSPPPGAVSVGEGPDAPSAEPVGDPARSAALGSQAPRIARLLALAARYVREDRLVSPRFDNALAVYREVLRADPGNRAAIEGLDAIRARLLRHAWAEEARGDLDSARRQLIKIQLIDAGEPVSGGQVRPGPLAANGPEPPVSSTLPASTAEEP
jgi:hypothetical protein